MKLHVLFESAREEAAIDLIKKTIVGTPFDRRVWIAGGFVRDEILGVPSKDIDIVVDYDNGGVKFSEWICKTLGIYKEGSNPVIYPKFGTAKFTFRDLNNLGQDLNGLDIECVMPRKDVGTTGKSRKDVITAQGTMKDDAERRDLTINALYKNVSTGAILDPSGKGLKDIKAKYLRTPADPDMTYGYPPEGDPLRMLRAIRFFARFGYTIDPGIITGIKKHLSKMATVSSERRRDELSKILETDRPVEAMDLLMQTGLIDYLIPELKGLAGLKQGIYHDKDAFGHTMDVLQKVKPNLVSRLAALLHDIGKPQARQPHQRKEYEFLEHEKMGSEIAKKILKRLKYPNKYPNDIIDRVSLLVDKHMGLRASRKELASDKSLRKFKRKVGDNLDDALDLMRADFEAHPGADASVFDAIIDRYKELERIEIEKPPPPMVTGHDIMKEFGITKGPMIGAMKNYLQGLYDKDPNIDKETALIRLREKFYPSDD